MNVYRFITALFTMLLFISAYLIWTVFAVSRKVIHTTDINEIKYLAHEDSCVPKTASFCKIYLKLRQMKIQHKRESKCNILREILYRGTPSEKYLHRHGLMETSSNIHHFISVMRSYGLKFKYDLFKLRDNVCSKSDNFETGKDVSLKTRNVIFFILNAYFNIDDPDDNDYFVNRLIKTHCFNTKINKISLCETFSFDANSALGILLIIEKFYKIGHLTTDIDLFVANRALFMLTKQIVKNKSGQGRNAKIYINKLIKCMEKELFIQQPGIISMLISLDNVSHMIDDLPLYKIDGMVEKYRSLLMGKVHKLLGDVKAESSVLMTNMTQCQC